MRLALVSAVLFVFGSRTDAVDGVTEINQVRALEGGISTADAPGFPVTINQAGSYRLTGNLTPPNATENTTAISITADNVTIDLNGFVIAGPVTGCPASCSASSGTGVGVSASTSRNNLTVFNGTVRGFGFRGVSLGADSRVERVQAVGNREDGINVGSGSTAIANVVRGNGDDGIATGTGATVGDNVVHDNGNDGIATGAGCTVVGNVVHDNRDDGIATGSGSTVSDNTSTSNGIFPNVGDGIQVGDDSNVIRNVVRDNLAHGVSGGTDGDLAFGMAGNVVSGNFAIVGSGAGCFQVTRGALETGRNSCSGDSQCPPASCLPPPAPLCQSDDCPIPGFPCFNPAFAHPLPLPALCIPWPSCRCSLSPKPAGCP